MAVVALVGLRNGIIPAGAGKSGDVGLCRGVRRDHPRGCVEKKWLTLCGDLVSGSSPRVRGKARLRWPRCRRGGIIPAGAGKRHRVFQARAFRGDHPRGCGEKPIDIQISNLREGSSPRVRGKASSARPSGFSTWIIPAGAGKRTTSFHVSPEAWDHPRGCGEKSEAREEYCPALGSSPRVRGKVSVSTLRVYLRGIIPAGAGKSMAFGVDDAIIGDHPRGCGEKPRALARARHRQGSSPRVRGKGDLFQRERGRGGSIPEGAG